MNEQTIFTEALEYTDPREQQSFLDQACQGDPARRQRLARLLAQHQHAGGFLEAPLVGSATIEPPRFEAPGASMGNYRLLQQIGAGGMGVVYLAEQVAPVQRHVALKIIQPGLDSRQVIARFEAERQALSLMDHPNIAKVLDAGTTASGRPYFVMELVKGQPITQYCDDKHLTPRQRLELMLPICQAIQHAHQKGIIHRDIKPTNILVAEYDQQPVPKVIDFGVAKATSQALTERTMFTACGQIVGTLEYMSPEQAKLNQLDIDTRSDIYSLGVLLYELLTGNTPFDRQRFRSAGWDEMLRIIREEEPEKPSTRLQNSHHEWPAEPFGAGPRNVPSLASIAAVRSTEPAKLTKLLRGELDWIVMKALDKDRGRRYESASSFAGDLERYLADEPVLAGPPSAAYRVRKFVGRNKGLVLAASLVGLVLIGGVIGTTFGLLRAQQRAEGERRARAEAQTRLAQNEKATEILAAVFRDINPMEAESEGVTLRDLLCRRLSSAAQRLEGEAVADSLVVARLQHLLGVSLRELGHLQQARLILEKAYQTREHMLGSDHLDAVATGHELAVLYFDQGEYALAEPILHAARAVRSTKLGNDHFDTLRSGYWLAALYLSRGKYALAESLFQEVLALQTAQLDVEHPDTLRSRHHLATLYHWQGKYAEAETLYQEVLASRTARLGANHLDTVATKSNLAALYAAQGRNDLAEPLLDEALQVRLVKLGADHAHTWTCQLDLAALYRSMQRYDQALATFVQVLERRNAKLGPLHVDTLDTQAELGMTYCDAGKFAQAIPLLEGVYQMTHEVPELARVGHSLLRAYARTGKTPEAIALATAQAQAARQQYPGNSPQRSTALAAAGSALLDAKLYAQAEPLLRESLAIAEEQYPDAWDTHGLRSLLGGALLGQNRYAEAEPFVVQGYEGQKKHVATMPRQARGYLITALERVVQLYEAWGQPEAAGKWRRDLEEIRTQP